jgi:hypothetical protein
LRIPDLEETHKISEKRHLKYFRHFENKNHQTKYIVYKIVLPKHVLFSKLVEKYKSCGPNAKIVVVGAILNYSAIL